MTIQIDNQVRIHPKCDDTEELFCEGEVGTVKDIMIDSSNPLFYVAVSGLSSGGEYTRRGWLTADEIQVVD